MALVGISPTTWRQIKPNAKPDIRINVLMDPRSETQIRLQLWISCQ